MKRLFLISGFLTFAFSAFAQEKSPAKFGNVKPDDFKNSYAQFNGEYNAIVLADVGSSKIEGNNKGWFSLNFKHYKRIHILNKNGFDLANVSISYFSSGKSEEKIEKLKAATYNLENGKVVETKLEIKGNVFEDKLNKYWKVSKFTFPNVKEGSIIEFEYVKSSDFLQNLQPWEFQGSIPRVWSEYNLDIPEFLGYAFIAQGDKKFDIETKNNYRTRYSITDPSGAYGSGFYTLDANVNEYRWVKKNVIPIKEESFTTSIDNYISKIEFQLQELRDPLKYRNLMSNWQLLSKGMLELEHFGGTVVQGKTGWLSDLVQTATQNATSDYDKAYKIHAYVRDNFLCTDYSELYIDKSLKDVVKNKKGNVAELNLLLVGMLNQAGLESDPVILSTRSHGKTNNLYPIMSKFNYVIARVGIGDAEYYLDASEPKLGFGKLPVRCYNGYARVINPATYQIDINSNNLMEAANTFAIIVKDESGKLQGSLRYQPGYYESLNARSKVKEKGMDEFKKDFSKNFTDFEVSEIVVDSLDAYENRLDLKATFSSDGFDEDVVYFQPLMINMFKDNPFKSENRNYPIEIPFAIDQAYQLQMDVPDGFKVDEIPQSIVLKLNEAGEGFFEYRISHSNNKITFRSRIVLARAIYQPEEYPMLREFFNQVVKKQSEQIVFKKLN